MDQQNIHTMKYYSALKGREFLARATTWMKLEDIMLSDKPLIKGQILPDSTYI